MDPSLVREIAARIASTAAGVEGVTSALVCSSEGAVLGAARVADPAREAALGSFIAARAEALPVDGDLRGMGKQLAGSRFRHMAVAADGGDSMLFDLTNGAYLSVRIGPGRTPATSAPLATLAQRATDLFETSMRSPRP